MPELVGQHGFKVVRLGSGGKRLWRGKRGIGIGRTEVDIGIENLAKLG